ncbi:MAG: type IV toxin-antitoxin system AbiEi family antitoxin domain-containing protein [Actinobacteria bacterium]|nr:type IV toxin-antitoxin system AbiEi family antitoxin domain-containing protein [Actinomycetota bacterium]
MKWTQLLSAVGTEPLFESGLLLVGDVDRADVTRQLSRWVASGKLVQLRRGLYAFAGSEARGRRAPSPYEIANRLVPGSYVSLSSVLARAGLIPEYVPVTTSITTGRPARYVTPLGTFIYRHVKPSMFWGFETLGLESGGRAFAAVPEKALIDLLYLDHEASDSAYLVQLRIQNLDRLQLDVLENMAQRCGVERVRHAASRIARMAQDEHESYMPWKADEEASR